MKIKQAKVMILELCILHRDINYRTCVKFHKTILNRFQVIEWQLLFNMFSWTYQNRLFLPSRGNQIWLKNKLADESID